MSTPTIENPPPAANTESKSARKKKAKADAAQQTAIPDTPAQEASDPAESNGAYEHPHLKELQKQIRNINKRLAGLQKTDAVVSENPGVSLDDLVKQRKINLDQKAAAEKKPQLQSQLQHYEEQVKVFRAVDSDYQSQLTKQKEELTSLHQKELEKTRQEAHTSATSTSASELRKKLLIFSQFLRTAAAKRNVEDNSDPAENDAFEGALLLAYGGDEKAVDAAVAIIEGSEEQVPSIEGVPLSVKYSQIRQASIENTPFQSEEAWVDSVAEANAATGETQAAQESTTDAVPAGSDPTLLTAGLTELEAPNDTQVNGLTTTDHDSTVLQASAGDEAGNQAGDRWDTGAGGAAQAEALEDDNSYEIVPRPNEEVDIPAPSAPAAPAVGSGVEGLLKEEKTSWADEANAASHHSTPLTNMNANTEAVAGNKAGEAWDTKPAGQTQSTGDAWGTPAAANVNGGADAASAAPADDGFQEIHRHQARGGRGGRGEFRGRGRGGRGGPRGDFRAGRGGRGGGEFRGEGRGRGDGEGRGRGRGRGGPAPAPARG